MKLLTFERDGKQVQLIATTEDEETAIAHATLYMLRKMHLIRERHSDLLDQSFWFGRGHYGTSIDMAKWLSWIEAAEMFQLNTRHPEELAPHMEVIESAIARLEAGEQLCMLDLIPLDKVKQSTIRIWREVWSNHPIRTAHERYRDWPEADTEIAQTIRIQKAMNAERKFWERHYEEVRRGVMGPRECYEYVSDCMWTAERFLQPQDRRAWLAHAPDLAHECGAPIEVLESRADQDEEITDDDDDE